VLAGLSFGFVSPRAIGEYIGRILFFWNDDKIEVITPLMVSRVAQLFPILVFDILGLSYVVHIYGGYIPVKFWIIGALLLISFVFTSIIFIPWQAIKDKYHTGTIIRKLIAPLVYLDVKDLIRVTGLSMRKIRI